MKAYLKLIVVLTLICLFWTALLAGVNAVTKDRIDEAARQKEIKAARDVLPTDAPVPELRGFGAVSNFVSIAENGNFVGAAVRGHSANGYGGNLVLMVGFTSAGDVFSFEVLETAETPGLGSKVNTPSFKDQFRGKPLSTRWAVKKDGGDIDAITAATISSRAALEAIREAVTQFEIIRDSLRNGAPTLP